MFGLMRSRACALGADERRRRRLHYCGTCKTMGRLYGQRSRILLNFDSVVAAEVLTALSEPDGLDRWDGAYQSVNCLRLPAEPASMPAALRYAAAITVVLAEVKIDDRIADSGRARWGLAQRALSRSFRRAAADLHASGFPLDALFLLRVRRRRLVLRVRLLLRLLTGRKRSRPPSRFRAARAARLAPRQSLSTISSASSVGER